MQHAVGIAVRGENEYGGTNEAGSKGRDPLERCFALVSLQRNKVGDHEVGARVRSDRTGRRRDDHVVAFVAEDRP